MTVSPPVVPDYDGANLCRIVPSLLADPGTRPVWLPAPLQDAPQTVLLLVDGLGWLQLQDRLPLAPTLGSMEGGPITSVAPSTTATALTSFTVGVPPAAHGVVGYRVVVGGPTGREVMNVLRWRTESGDARPFVAPREFQPIPPFSGRSVPVVSSRGFAGSGFSDAHQYDAPLAGFVTVSGMAIEVRNLLMAGEPLVYAYYEGIDKVSHVKGFGEYYDAELAAVDRLVGDLLSVLPPGSALAVTADHGQVEVGASAAVLDQAVVEEAAFVSGEARFRWLHARETTDGGVGRLADAARLVYGDQAWVVTVDEISEQGWFGGPLGERVRSRVGDVAVVPFLPVGYLDREEGREPPLACRHGSLTPEEMLVPFLAQGRMGR